MSDASLYLNSLQTVKGAGEEFSVIDGDRDEEDLLIFKLS